MLRAARKILGNNNNNNKTTRQRDASEKAEKLSCMCSLSRFVQPFAIVPCASASMLAHPNPIVAMPFYLHDCICMEFHRVRQNYLHKYYMNYCCNAYRTPSSLYGIINTFSFLPLQQTRALLECCGKRDTEQCVGSGDLHFHYFHSDIANDFLSASVKRKREKIIIYRIAFD